MAEQQKPVGPFDDHEACVRHFEDDPAVDNPDALCGWMEANSETSVVEEYQPGEDEVQALVDAMNDPNADTVLTDLQVTHVSGVDDPAQDSQWVMAKDTTNKTDADWGVNAPILFKSRSPLRKPEPDEAESGNGDSEGGEQRKAWAPVLIPNETDKQGDVIPADAIEKAAHVFLSEFRNIDTDHNLLEGKGVPIESWTLKEESVFTLPDGSTSREYPKGTWMLGVKFTEDTWKRVQDGDLSGFSIYGEATEHAVDELLGTGGVEVSEMDTTVAEYRATAKDAGSETTRSMTEEDTAPDDGGHGQDAPDSNDGEPDEGEPTLKELTETMDSMHESVKSVEQNQEDHAERLEALEAEVYEKQDEDDDEDDEGEDDDGPEVDPEKVAEQAAEEATAEATDAAEDAAEAKVKSMLGLNEDESLPEDPGERKEVVRKHLHEPPEDDGGPGDPDAWTKEEISEAVK
jgi:hypothetical protein